MTYYTRIQRLIEVLKTENIESVLISNPVSIFYFTNYQNFHPGERLFLLRVTKTGEVQLILNRLFPEPKNLPIACEQLWYKDGEQVLDNLAALFPEESIIGIDKDWPSHFLLSLMALAPHCQFINGSRIVDHLRSIKSKEEQALLIEASRLNDQAMTYIISLVKEGLTESQMTEKLEDKYLELSENGFSFDPIIAYGPNGADPHHETSHDKPEKGQSVVIDIGSSYKGYMSDMTRTVFYGQPDEESETIYQIVKAANEAAIAQVKVGVTYASIDKAARDVIESAGYGQYFTHRTGHQIGMEVHEPGDVGAFNEGLVEVGHVFSIEPGIYLPGKLGVRIEDLVIVTEDGPVVINHVSKDIIICE